MSTRKDALQKDNMLCTANMAKCKKARIPNTNLQGDKNKTKQKQTKLLRILKGSFLNLRTNAVLPMKIIQGLPVGAL